MARGLYCPASRRSFSVLDFVKAYMDSAPRYAQKSDKFDNATQGAAVSQL